MHCTEQNRRPNNAQQPVLSEHKRQTKQEQNQLGPRIMQLRLQSKQMLPGSTSSDGRATNASFCWQIANAEALFDAERHWSTRQRNVWDIKYKLMNPYPYNAVGWFASDSSKPRPVERLRTQTQRLWLCLHFTFRPPLNESIWLRNAGELRITRPTAQGTSAREIRKRDSMYATCSESEKTSW